MRELKFLNAERKKNRLQELPLLAAACLSSFLLVAAYGKLFFPSEKLYVLDYVVSIFELVFIACLLIYRNHVETWLFSSMVFASWGGYALFWYLAELPCWCMGNWVSIPKGLSLVLDALFFFLSLSVAFVLGAKRRWLTLCFVNALIFMWGGFAFAKWIFASVMVF